MLNLLDSLRSSPPIETQVAAAPGKEIPAPRGAEALVSEALVELVDEVEALAEVIRARAVAPEEAVMAPDAVIA